MRVIAAALIFYVFFMGLLKGFLYVLPAGAPEWAKPVGGLFLFVISLLITNRVINVQGTSFWTVTKRGKTTYERLEEEGMLVSEAYRTERALRVDEPGPQGPHYFVETEEGVLHLNGDYLREYEPRRTLGIFKRHRQFPCTYFVVKRLREDNSVLFLQFPKASGFPFEPERREGAVGEAERKKGLLPQDGHLITKRTYDELKAALGNRAPEA